MLTDLTSWTIVGYQRLLSSWMPSSCRFHPSCSAYAIGALRSHGALRGGWLALTRIARCHPFHPGGLDPVPPSPGRGAGDSGD